MSKRPIRRVEVAHTEDMTPHMRRITFQGESLAEFPSGCEGDYVKLVLEPAQGDRPLMRSFTVRRVDPEARRLVLDFVLHQPAGPATQWAGSAQVGQVAHLYGPGPVKSVDLDADWVFLAADMTGLPALAANLERLPANAVGHALVEILSDEDQQSLDKPAGVELTWIVQPHPTASRSLLADAVLAVPWREGRPGVWMAAEFNAMRTIRRYLREVRGVGSSEGYLSSYWKVDATDEQHKMAKKAELA